MFNLSDSEDDSRSKMKVISTLMVKEESDVEESDEDEEGVESGLPKSKNLRKRCSWNHAEEELLLKLCIQKKIVDKIDGKYRHKPHVKIFNSISVLLNNANLGASPKNAFQCRGKFKKMKMSYYDCLKMQGKSGEECSHYDLLSQLFPKRPRMLSQVYFVDTEPEVILNESNVNEDSSDASASRLEAPTTSRGSTGSKRKTPKYKSEANCTNPIVNLMNTFMERSAEETKRQNEWFAQQMKIFNESIAKSKVREDSSDASASELQTPSTSRDSTGSKPKPPKYRCMGNRQNPILNLMNTFMERSVEESKKQNEWFKQQLEIQNNSQKEVMLTITKSFETGVAALVHALSNNSASASQAAHLPTLFSQVPSPQYIPPPATSAQMTPPEASPPTTCNSKVPTSPSQAPLGQKIRFPNGKVVVLSNNEILEDFE